MNFMMNICLCHIRKMMFSFQNICRENPCWGNTIRLYHHCSFFFSEIECKTGCFVLFINLELQEIWDYIVCHQIYTLFIFYRSATVPIRGRFERAWRILPFQWLSETMYLLITRRALMPTNRLSLRIRNKR